MQEAWQIPMDNASFKTVTSREAKQASLLYDKTKLMKRSHAWTVINLYKAVRAQLYLNQHFNLRLKDQFIYYRFGQHETKDLIPSWKNHHHEVSCRLCGYDLESLIHIFCASAAMLGARRKLLRPAFLRSQVRSSRQAVITWLEGTNSLYTCLGSKFLILAKKK